MSISLAFIGSVIGAVAGLASAKATNKANERAAETANAFTKEQLQNRHQWEVADLRAAGLNPILSAMGTPSIGGSAQASTVNPMDSIASGSGSAIQAMRIREEIKNMKETNKKLSAETNLSHELANSAKEDQKLKRTTAGNIAVQTMLSKLDLPGKENDATIQEKIGPYGAAAAKFINSAAGTFTGGLIGAGAVKGLQAYGKHKKSKLKETENLYRD